VYIRAVYGFSLTKIFEKEVCITACHLMFHIEHSKGITLVFNNIVIKKRRWKKNKGGSDGEEKDEEKKDKDSS